MYKRKKLSVFFSHHPVCDQYGHHVLQIFNWRFCLGCIGVYPTIILLVIFTAIGLISFEGSVYIYFFIGILFFIPAVIQLYWKSKYRLIKYFMRVSLGVSSFYLGNFIFYFPFFWGKIISTLIFTSGVVLYSIKQTRKSLIECKSCPFGYYFETCLRKFDYIFEIENLELAKNMNTDISRLVKLRKLRDLEKRKE